MNDTVECPVDRNLPPQGPPWGRWSSGLLYFILFCIISTICLLWALGYRVNWTAETIERTGLIEISSPQAGLNPEVYVNGVKSTDTLPLTLRWLFPGHYKITIKEEGYQTWEKTISVGENERVSYPGILLLYTNPKSVTPPSVRTDEIVNRSYDNDGIEIKQGNELWVDDQFITRTSDDIANAEYYLNNKHVIYQAGSQLIVRDLVAGTSETLVTFTSQTPVPYVMKDNGRVLVYLDGDTLKAVELFQATSIIDRLGVSH
jgi:hypothetical protein